MYQPDVDAIGGSLTGTALVAALPLVVLFALLGGLRMTAWKASLAALATALLIAVLAYGMPVDDALLSATEGAAFGFFPILWIVINAIWIYNMTVETGHFDVLRRSFAAVSDDQRIQAIIIAFCFGALLEALAGFGTPVAISAVMLIALGFTPMKAATVALVANTAPVAFGALAVPIVTLAEVTGLPQADLGAIVGRQTPILALFVPLALVFIIDKGKGIRQVWPAAVTCGVAFAVAQFVTSNYFSVELTDIVAALVGAVATVALLRVWQPAESYREADRESEPARAGGGSGGSGATAADGGSQGDTKHLEDTPANVARAYSPYLIIIVVFSIAQIPAINTFLDSPTVAFTWPGLSDVLDSEGAPAALTEFTFNWLLATGTLLIVAGLLTMAAIGISPARALAAYFATYKQLAAAIATVMTVLGLAYLMNLSGQTVTLGTWMAAAGAAFAVLSPVLGWLGVAVTGSDTSSNSLFGGLQVTAAEGAGLDPELMAASNSSGGVLGKMVSPQNLAIAAGAVGLAGREGDLFRKVVGWSLGLLAIMCLLVVAQTTFLAWMLP
ncbi:MAG: L-lactate permease [Actinomycetota bacterium]|nr:L-lactate permease [Actinomycetota bacterium]